MTAWSPLVSAPLLGLLALTYALRPATVTAALAPGRLAVVRAALVTGGYAVVLAGTAPGRSGGEPEEIRHVDIDAERAYARALLSVLPA